jgi:branched-chain amino acid aminotransferase
MTTDIRINRIDTSLIDTVDFNDLGFGKYFCDHMFSLDYTDGEWRNPQILPYGPVPVEPGACSLHYGQAVFEGLKAFHGKDGAIRVFRPDMNAQRMRVSCERLCIPPIDQDVFVRAIVELVKLDRAWIPSKRGEAFYVRPLIFSTEGHLDVRPSNEYRFLIMTSPVCAYFGDEFRAIALKVEDKYTRAAPGGMGYVKTGGNYAASLLPGQESLNAGYNQVLWLDGRDHIYVEEAGQMNIVFKLDGKFVTPPLKGTILPGVTRDSVLTLLRDKGHDVEERPTSINEVLEGSKNGKLQEAFGCGTAAVVCPVGQLFYQDQIFNINNGEPGPSATELYDEILGIQLGEVEDKHGWNVVVE